MGEFYHCATWKKLKRYQQNGLILPPVRAWKDIASAERFAKQTRRPVILLLRIDSYRQLEGHRGQAVITDNIVRLQCL